MAEENGPVNVSVDTSRVSASSLRDDPAFQMIMARQEQQTKLQTKAITEKIGDAITEAAPLIAGLGLLQMTDSPIIALGGAYFGDKIKDAMQERKQRKAANREEMKLRRMAADIAVEQGQFATREEALLAISENRQKEELANTKKEQDELLERFGILKGQEDATNLQTEAAEAQIEMAEKVSEAFTPENIAASMDATPGTEEAASVERINPEGMNREQLTQAFRDANEELREQAGVKLSGTDQAVVDAITGLPISNAEMASRLESSQDALEKIAASMDSFVDLTAMDSEREKQRWMEDREARREASRGSGPGLVPAAAPAGAMAEEKGGGLGSFFKRKKDPTAGAKEPKGVGVIGKVGRSIGEGVGGVVSGIVQAFGNPGAVKAAGFFAIAFPLIGAGLGGFIAAVSVGIAAASWIMGKALPTLADGMSKLQPALKGFEELDGDKLSAAAGGMKDMLGGLASVGVGGLVSQLADTSGLSNLARTMKEFEEIDGAKLQLIGPAMTELGKGLGATGLGSIVGSIGKLFGGDGPEEQFKAAARGLMAFSEVDGDKIAKVGPAIGQLGPGIKALSESGGLLSGIGKAFASFFGVADDPIANVRKFEVLGEPETAAKLQTAGAAVQSLADGLKSFSSVDTKGFEKIQTAITPLTQMADAVAKVGPDFGIIMNKTFKSFHHLQGLETIKWSLLGQGLEKFGNGLEEFADYIDDGEIKTIAEASIAIERFGKAFRMMNPQIAAVPKSTGGGSQKVVPGTAPDAASSTLGQLIRQRQMEDLARIQQAQGGGGTVVTTNVNNSNQTYNRSPINVRSNESTLMRKVAMDYDTAFADF
jgi:hypothetical protein